MSRNVLVDETHLMNIAQAIRSKGGTTRTYKPSEMAAHKGMPHCAPIHDERS